MPDILARTARKLPDRPAICYEGSEITYRRLDELVHRFAHALADLGVKEGDKVAVLLPNIPQVMGDNYNSRPTTIKIPEIIIS